MDGGRMVYDAAQRAGDTRETPVWEPYLYLDASGRLVAYYATERYKEEGYNQALAYKISEDGGRTWGEERSMVAVGYSQTMIPLGDGREILHLVPVDGEIKYAKFSLPDHVSR